MICYLIPIGLDDAFEAQDKLAKELTVFEELMVTKYIFYI